MCKHLQLYKLSNVIFWGWEYSFGSKPVVKKTTDIKEMTSSTKPEYFSVDKEQLSILSILVNRLSYFLYFYIFTV